MKVFCPCCGLPLCICPACGGLCGSEWAFCAECGEDLTDCDASASAQVAVPTIDRPTPVARTVQERGRQYGLCRQDAVRSFVIDRENWEWLRTQYQISSSISIEKAVESLVMQWPDDIAPPRIGVPHIGRRHALSLRLHKTILAKIDAMGGVKALRGILHATQKNHAKA